MDPVDLGQPKVTEDAGGHGGAGDEPQRALHGFAGADRLQQLAFAQGLANVQRHRVSDNADHQHQQNPVNAALQEPQ